MKRKYHPRGKLVDGYLVRDHPLYCTYHNMKSRCLNKKDTSYKNYGGRGITICKEWMDSFETFAKDMGVKPRGTSIERKDNNKGYCKDNCKWGTPGQQAWNRRKFQNNTSGVRGVYPVANGRFCARVDIENTPYNLGRFSSPKEAEKTRLHFIKLFNSNPSLAITMTNRRPRYDSSTGVKGITKMKTGYVVKPTRGGVRFYLGHFKDLKDAVSTLKEWESNDPL